MMLIERVLITMDIKMLLGDSGRLFDDDEAETGMKDD